MQVNESLVNRTCNLECLKGNREIKGFTGLVNIILVKTPKGEYYRRVWWAGLIGLAYMLMGATVTTVLFFSLAMTLSLVENLHVFVCTFGFQLFIPSGILMFSNINGPSAPMTAVLRKTNHIFLQLTGLGFSIGTAIAVILSEKYEDVSSVFTFHCVAGVFACFLAVFTAIFGPVVLLLKAHTFMGDLFHSVHKGGGIACFVTSSVCFISGLLKPSFQNWLPLPEMLYFLIAYCIVYTFIIIIVPFIKCVSTNNEETE